MVAGGGKGSEARISLEPRGREVQQDARHGVGEAGKGWQGMPSVRGGESRLTVKEVEEGSIHCGLRSICAGGGREGVVVRVEETET